MNLTQQQPSDAQPVLDSPAAPVLELNNIVHHYGGVKALDGCSLSIAKREVVCLLGPSGCGKTTALRLSAGLEELQSGEIRLNGSVIADARRQMPPEQRKIGFLFQDYALFPHLSISQNVAFGLTGKRWLDIADRVRHVLAHVEMEEYGDRYPHELSGGQQQRVALARALAPEPAIVLLDEPFSGLDARMRDKVRDETLHFLKSSNAATLMVTHDAEEAMFMADRIAVMAEGNVQQAGSPDDLYCHPNSPFVAAFFGEVNRIGGTVRNGKVETPVGEIGAPGIADGTDVAVLIRPEALKLSIIPSAMTGKNAATVLAARMLGRTSLIHLSLINQHSGTIHLHSRMYGRFLPNEHALVNIDLDETQVFVFPAKSLK